MWDCEDDTGLSGNQFLVRDSGYRLRFRWRQDVRTTGPEAVRGSGQDVTSVDLGDSSKQSKMWKPESSEVCSLRGLCVLIIKRTITVSEQAPRAYPEWSSGLQRRACCLLHGRSWVRALARTSTNACRHMCKYMNQGIRNLRNQLCAGEKACTWGIHHGFETQGRHHQKSKTGASVAPRKGLMYPKMF